MNRREYGRLYDYIPFADPAKAGELNAERNRLLERLAGKIELGFGGTKGDCANLSNGCRLCGEGLWSCLFINGECNARCFYCPAPQDEPYPPGTNSVTFNSPDEYVAYLREFGFKGVSISGGEPLLTPERTLSYISAVRREFPEMYIWMYTNGILLTKERAEELRDAGLDELRFDIGATSYSLDNLKKAVGVIPVVTVEIPSVPEEKDTIKERMRELAKLGVNHLNLHQLRLTPHNAEKLLRRDYTYAEEERVVVIESEITALELMLFSIEEGLGLPVNYCSFPYKNRYQGLAARKRSAGYMLREYEEITENGYIRLIRLDADPETLKRTAENADDPEEFLIAPDGLSLYAHPELLRGVSLNDAELNISYYSARQLQSVSYKHPFRTIPLSDEKNVVIERFQVTREFKANGREFADFVLGRTDKLPDELRELEIFEKTPKGLLEY